MLPTDAIYTHYETSINRVLKTSLPLSTEISISNVPTFSLYCVLHLIKINFTINAKNEESHN